MIKVGAYGPESARIMLVGEAPGEQEVKEGRPFVGSAGQLLRKALMSVGINPDDCYMTNICHVRPPNNELRQFFDEATGIPNDYVLDGMEALQRDIRRIKPHVIVALGNFPLWALAAQHEGRPTAQWKKVKRDKGQITTFTGIGNWRGSILESTLARGFKVIPTYHPSYINREGYSDHGTFITDLTRVEREAGFPEIRRPKKDFFIDPRGPRRLDLIERLQTPPGYDPRVEAKLGVNNILTTDIEFLNNTKLLCVGVTNQRDWAATIALRSPTDLEFIRKVFALGLPINAQNSMFDLSVMAWHYGIDIFHLLRYDTMLASHAANIELPKGLDYLTSVYTDEPHYKDMVDWKLIKAGKQSIDTVLEYNCKDVWTQHEVMEEQIFNDFLDMNDLAGSVAAWRTFNFEMLLQTPLWEMSRLGVRVDHEKLTKLSNNLLFEAQGLNSMLDRFAGWAVNVKSGPQISRLLYQQMGLPVIATTGTKNKKTGDDTPKTDDKTLATLTQKCKTELQQEIINLIRDIRNRLDLRSKFTEVEFDADKRARGMYSPAGTDTGRLASKKFYPTGLGLQQQNIPTDKRARSVFVPDEGMVFGYADLERAESLVVAYLTGDPEMLRVHGPGIDAHKELASRLFDMPVEEIGDSSDERALGKRTRHAGNYMQGPITFMNNVNQQTKKTGISITLQQAKKFIEIYRQVHPFLGLWWKEVEAELWASRTLWNLLGRRRIFYGHIKSIVPAAVAYTPQSTVGDALNIGLLNVSGIPCDYMREQGLWNQYKLYAEELKDCGFQALLQVHDAVGYQVWERDVDRANSLIQKLLSIPLTVPKTLETFTIPVEVLTGPSWGQVKKWVNRRAGDNGEEVKQLA